ncbi:MAG TPA: DUF192 domain-containing protein [Burkholderiales bacterium]|nr:DUF192 domain-containing protein [Burkholderiales bacterium]
MKMRTIRVCSALLMLWALPALAQLPEIELEIDGHRLTVEVASRPQQLERGLMYRRMLPENRGMLFVFDAPQALNFWMKNTYLPLSIAFIGANGVIVNIDDMKPQTTRIHSSSAPAKFALEVNQGWFRRNHIEPGAHVGNLAQIPAAQ